MNVSLTPKLEEWVQSKVESGFYGSSSEVVREALRLMHNTENDENQKLTTLRSELQIGLNQLKEAKSVIMTDDLWAEIRNKAKAELKSEQTQ